ncbi:MAG TPA: tetratricopeptide repeat protein [Pyrinomonadaceae bacterium]|nr:tetratricopeptide repeat protein [Pyrinomonadaceae bacterium]
MRKRTIIAVIFAFVLTVGFTALWSAEGDEQEGDTATNIVAARGAETGTADAPKKKGNRFARFFKAPFKAVGKLLGGGDDDKIARMSEKDARRFESVGVVKVEDRRSGGTDESTAAATGSAQDSLARGRAALEAGQLNEAIAELSRAASMDAKLAQAHSLLAVAYDRKGLHERARESYERAIDLNERDAQALNNLGYSLYLNGNYRAAVDRLKRAARLAPSDTRILNNLALAQCRLGKYDDALKSFTRAGGEFNGRMNVAALLERAGRDEDAIRHYEQARRLQPEATGVLRRLADLYARTGQSAQAEDARRALDALDARDALAAGGK